MKDLKFICVQPDDTYYTWQVHLWLESLRKLGHSDKAIVLVFIPNFREKNIRWGQVIDLYPEAEFHFYKDVDKISKFLGIYIPVLRPYCLMKHFDAHPELKEKAIFYCDSDVIFTPQFNIDKYKDDDVCYLSDTNSYINASYFDSKIRDVIPERLEEYKKIDVLEDISKMLGVSRAVCEKNNLNSGGAQYLLKNIDGDFWKRVLEGCLVVRTQLQAINKQYFENENRGFQSWCADMWSVLWNLWRRNQETRVVPEMDFAWAPDPVEKLKTIGILHNAGVTGPIMDKIPYFYKGAYHQGKNPFDDPHLKTVKENTESQKRCTHYYLTNLLELKDKYNVDYLK